MINLDTSVEEVPKIGVAYAKKLKKFGVKTIQDLLFYFPARYDDFSEIIFIKQARQRLGEVVCLQGRIAQIETTKTWARGMSVTEATVEDNSGQIQVIWYNQPYLSKSLKEDDFVCLAGKVSLGKGGLFLNSPVQEKINEIGENDEFTHTGRIVPV